VDFVRQIRRFSAAIASVYVFSPTQYRAAERHDWQKVGQIPVLLRKMPGFSAL
jgi:hypothetical protein